MKDAIKKQNYGIAMDILYKPYPEFQITICTEHEESEDEKISKALIKLVKKAGEGYENVIDGVSIENAISWLEKQYEHSKFYDSIQVGDKVTRNKDGVLVNLSQLNRVAKPAEKQGKQKPVWGEEGEKKINYLIAWLQNSTMHNPALRSVNEGLEEWLKSLKERYTWKPSDEQMATLEYYMHTLVCNSYKETLFGLYQDLKKLREE